MLNKQTLISIEDALPGREQPMQIEDCHFVNQSSLTAPLAHHQQQILLGMGCFWGAERLLAIGWRGFDICGLCGWVYQIQPTKKCVRVKPVILRL